MDWGMEAVSRLAPSEVVVVVDVLGLTAEAITALDTKQPFLADTPTDASARHATRIAVAAADAEDGGGADNADGSDGTDGAAAPGGGAAPGGSDGGSEVEGGAIVILAGLCNAAAVARAVMAIQVSRAKRTSITVIAAGERDGSAPDAPLRFAAEDQLGAGAVIAALSDLGIDHASPEAAVASESFRALRPALRHLIAATGTGRDLAAHGLAGGIAAASAVDSSEVVPVLQGRTFRAFEPSQNTL